MSEALQKKITFDHAQIGGVRLHYATAGSGDELIILLHGFPEFWYSWRRQLVDLSDRYTVVAPDMRGYNLSDKPEKVSDYEIEKLVEDVLGLIQKSGREKAHVVGHDWGAAVGWALALEHPEHVDRLVAMQVPPAAVWRRNQTLRQYLASWYMFLFQLPKLPEWMLSLNDYQGLADGLRRSTAVEGVFTDEEIAEYKKAWSEAGALTAAINYYRANILRRLYSSHDDTRRVRVPTLFIYGELDHAVLPETVAGVGEYVDAEYEEVRVPTSGHWVQQEAPEAVTDAIRSFLSKKDDETD